MTSKMGAKGQVVVPKAIRDEVGLHPGDLIDFEFRGGEVVLIRREREMKPLGGRYAGSGMLEAHMAQRARERARGRW